MNDRVIILNVSSFRVDNSEVLEVEQKAEVLAVTGVLKLFTGKQIQTITKVVLLTNLQSLSDTLCTLSPYTSKTLGENVELITVWVGNSHLDRVLRYLGQSN